MNCLVSRDATRFYLNRKCITAIALAIALPPLVRPAVGQDDAKSILAAQVRSQGYLCDSPQSARQDVAASRPDEAVWILICEDATYKVHLVPDMAAHIEQQK